MLEIVAADDTDWPSRLVYDVCSADSCSLEPCRGGGDRGVFADRDRVRRHEIFRRRGFEGQSWSRAASYLSVNIETSSRRASCVGRIRRLHQRTCCATHDAANSRSICVVAVAPFHCGHSNSDGQEAMARTRTLAPSQRTTRCFADNELTSAARRSSISATWERCRR